VNVAGSARYDANGLSDDAATNTVKIERIGGRAHVSALSLHSRFGASLDGGEIPRRLCTACTLVTTVCVSTVVTLAKAWKGRLARNMEDMAQVDEGS
jgi:hypothetical protein